MSNPRTWGEDSLIFKPDRWIPTQSKVGEAIELIQPAKGTFLPWSSGPRICPGQKMSQVEFVSVVSTLLRKTTVEPIVMQNEGIGEARKRVLATARNSAPILTLQMKHPEDIRLRWIPR
jgi:cytochrome P450